MKKRSLLLTLVLAGMLTLVMAATSFAGQWILNDNGWWYRNDDGSFPAAEWKWIDSDGDGVAECYYFYADGYMAHNDYIGDDYVNRDGQWMVGNQVQHKMLASQGYKSPEGSFYLNGQFIPTMPDMYADSYYDCINIGVDYDGSYWMTHVTGRHPGTASGIWEIRPNVPTRYDQVYKGYVEESGSFTFDGNDVIYLRVDGTYEVLTYIRR